MINFELPPEYDLFRKSVKAFAAKEVAPLIDEAEEKQEFPKQLLEKMGQQRMLCLTIPEEYGGPGGDIHAQCIFTEELGYVSLGIAIGTMVHAAYAATLLLECGTQEQKRRYLPKACQGTEVWAFAATEADAGSDRSRIHTTVTDQGDHLRLNGSKCFITNSTIADYLIVEAYSDKSKGMAGLSLYIVPRTTEGLSVRKLSKAGIRCSEIAEIFFDNCKLSKDSQLGVTGEAFQKVRRARIASWLLVGARAIGVARAAFDATLAHAKNRVQFGRPIGHFQAVSFKLAQMSLEIDAARLLMLRAAALYHGDRECFTEASMLKLFSSEMAVRITNEALQIHGAHGYMMDSPIQRHFRDARMLTFSEGTSEIQHINLARALGLHADDYYQ